jgi:signal transduction histidine kinase
MCRLENQGLLLGLVGLTRPASTCDDFPNLFASVWEHQKNQWEQLQLETALARRTEILEVIQAVGNTITSQLEIHDILQSVVEQATILMKAKTASLMLVNRETNELVLESVYGSSPDYIRKPNLDISTSLIGRVIRSGKPLMVRDVRECSAYQHRELAGSEGLVSLLSVPLKWRDTCMGALNVYSARRYRYTRDNVDLLSLLASQSAIAIQNAQTLSQAKRLEAQVHDLDKRSLVGELAAGVAHEIRNPLTVVTMLIDAWEAHDANEAEDLQVISTQLKGINRCVTQLLEIAKPRPLEMSWVNLEHEIAASLQVLRIRFEDQGVALQLSLAPNLPVVHVDSARFHQLLMNLCLNALNAMLQGGKISLSTAQTTPAAFECLPGTTIVPWKGWGVSLPSLCGERLGASPHPPSFPLSTAERESRGELFVLLSLADAGGGIQVNREEHSTLTAYQCDLKEIFEPFRSQTPGGFGLGLSVVKRIVEEHQAGLKVYNQPGKGLTFFLLLEGGVVALTH